MSTNIRTGYSNTRAVFRMQTQLSLGRHQMINYRKELSKPITDTVTYYLLKDGRVVSFREWYQLNQPSYVVSGTKHGCFLHAQSL